VQGTEHGTEPTLKELHRKYWEQGWLQQWTTMKQPEQPQMALPPMSSHHSTSWLLTVKNWQNFGQKRPGTRCNNMTQHGTSKPRDKRPRTQRRHKTTTRHCKRQAQQTPGKTRTTAQETHSTLLKSSNWPMTATRRRQGQQIYAWHATSSRRPRNATPFPLTLASGATQPQPPALPPEA